MVYVARGTAEGGCTKNQKVPGSIHSNKVINPLTLDNIPMCSKMIDGFNGPQFMQVALQRLALKLAKVSMIKV
jgi:hypothetical protein